MSAGGHDPWVRYRNTGLYAVPSIHHRQIFAQLVLEACHRKKFNVIAVELPPSYQQFGIIDAGLRLAPAPGMIIHPTGGKVELMEVPIYDDPQCKETELRPVKRGLFYPFTPCDSIVMALRCPQLLQARWPGWQPEVTLIDGEYRFGERPNITFAFRDDYEVMVDGLAAFLERMDAQWTAARCPLVDDHRDKVMGSRLRRLLDAGKEVLFVCGLAHWRNLCTYLDSGVRETLETSREQPATRLIMAPIRPDIAWLWGWLEDVPRALWDMELCCQCGTISDYDKRQAVQTVVRESFTEAQAREIPVSIRRLQKMERYLQTLTSTAGRWVPELDDHLVLAAEACVESRFAEVLKEQALKYPAPLPPGLEMARVLPAEDGKWFVIAEGEVFVLEFPKSRGTKSERRLAIPVPRPLSEKEQGQGDKNPFRRDWPGELNLRYIMDLRARELAKNQQRIFFSRRFAGSMAAGPDWRRTIRARASGERTMFVRQLRSGYTARIARSPVVAPVVWIFDDRSPIIHRDVEGMDPVKELFTYVGLQYIVGKRSLASGEIDGVQFAAWVDMGASKGFLGKARPCESQPRAGDGGRFGLSGVDSREQTLRHHAVA